ncbi:Exonuclease domain-containing protein [Caenorhabditis elegans]|uniref:Exonuclease domain-containing protein n=1 Tax=Caenorhabditis elegans TaxID=6239 RepID=H2L0F9_CAEEL|nr:Exonuclease domain-containing protein [Caenorhabditis elegans]CCD72933.1 Exonuclease domain-containing protein [Caenorhabditis elegans]|eukprot:NP_001024182.2 Uncharacterized protein CELE_W02F12.4 [Caenorhabditis elegans]
MKRSSDFTPTTTPSKIATWTLHGDVTPERKRGPPILLKASPTKQIQKRSAYSREFIKTYVFFDLECTGLIKNEDTRNLHARAFNKAEEHYNVLNNLCIETRKDELPYITEMSFMAISSEKFDELKAERQKDITWNIENPGSEKPLAKFIPTCTHTRQINPTMMSETEWNSYERFRLAGGKVAHNAIKYDLRVIYGELQRNEVLEEFGIPQDIYFIDSYWMAREIEDTIVKELATVCKYIKFPKVKIEEVDESERVVIDDSVEEIVQNDEPKETDHPANILDWEKFSASLKKRIRRDGFVRTGAGSWTYKHTNNKFSLPVLYEDLVGGKYTAHYAQQDTEALMHVCLSYGNDFTRYANNSASALPF